MATEKTFHSYSAKPSMLSTGAQYGVNEMVETGTSMGLQQGRQIIVTGVTKDLEDGFIKDVLQDGVNAGVGYLSGQAMQFQEQLLDKAFTQTRVMIGSWYAGRGALRDKFKEKFRKGRKATMFSKILGDNNDKVEECRLIADVGKMDIDTSSSSGNPLSRQNVIKNKFQHEALEVQKEGVSSSLAKLQIDGMRDTFEMKIRTSSFFNTDKKLIKAMTGLTSVTDKDIKKLNTLSNSQVFQDSEGNWIGGNEAMIVLMNGLGLHRA